MKLKINPPERTGWRASMTKCCVQKIDFHWIRDPGIERSTVSLIILCSGNSIWVSRGGDCKVQVECRGTNGDKIYQIVPQS